MSDRRFKELVRRLAEEAQSTLYHDMDESTPEYQNGVNCLIPRFAAILRGKTRFSQKMREPAWRETGALSPIRPADDIIVRLDNLAQSLAGEYPPDTLMDLAEAASLITTLRSQQKAGASRTDAPIASVRNIPDEVLLRRAVFHARAKHKRKGEKHPRWFAVMGAFELGSTYSAELCRRFQLDPDEEVSR